MNDRILAMWQTETCMGERLDKWMERKLLEQCATIDAQAAEISRQQAYITKLCAQLVNEGVYPVRMEAD